LKHIYAGVLALLVSCALVFGGVPDKRAKVPPRRYELSIQTVDMGKSAREIYNDLWTAQGKAERIIFISKDGRAIIFGSKEKEQISVSANDVNRELITARVLYSQLKYVVHNHEKAEQPSASDMKFIEYMRECGFEGEAHVYTPDTGQVQTISSPAKLESEKDGRRKRQTATEAHPANTGPGNPNPFSVLL